MLLGVQIVEVKQCCFSCSICPSFLVDVRDPGTEMNLVKFWGQNVKAITTNLVDNCSPHSVAHSSVNFQNI